MIPHPSVIASLLRLTTNESSSYLDHVSHREARELGFEDIGSGLYARAYLQKDGTVLKVSRYNDGTSDYAEWCMLRLKKYGKGSREMAGFPEVEAFGRMDPDDLCKGWWCVMPCYVSTREARDCVYNYSTKTYSEPMCGRDNTDYTAACKVQCDYIQRRFEVDYLDLHGGNYMWDPARKQWLVTDPLSTTGSGKTPALDPMYPAIMMVKPRKVAQWKRSPLQQLAPRRA